MGPTNRHPQPQGVLRLGLEIMDWTARGYVKKPIHRINSFSNLEKSINVKMAIKCRRSLPPDTERD